MIMRRKPLLYNLDEWQWTARGEFEANVIMKVILGGGRAKGNHSARQNYYVALHNALKTQGQKTWDPDAMNVNAMCTNRLSREEQEKLQEEHKCFNCKRKGHLAWDCRQKNQGGSTRQKNKGKKPQSSVRNAKVKENHKNKDDGSFSTSKKEDPPGYKKKDDIAAAIRRMTAEQKESALKQLAAEGF